MPEATQRIIPAASAPAIPAFPASVFHLGAGIAPAEPEDAPAAPPVATAAPAGTPASTPAPTAPVTKVDLAIAYVMQYGEASRAELASAMGLESDSHVKSFLKTPLADGRLHAEGDRYTIGTGQPPTTPRRARTAPPRAKPQHTQSTPPTLTAAIDVQATSAHIQVGGISICVRHSGRVSISANGSTVELTPDKANIMRAFDALLAQGAGVAA
ncbi:hypothetical protein CNECB9_1270007 [Cupriavidus necator]|uniref:Uncharacterized protein n=1 Tax=Cupriavidus necator TaxID=106590 RepID=A0A1K0J6X6_CUPNE|nr:hypothetical protein CNECB9_1270007 [Cupriavidus necator]